MWHVAKLGLLLLMSLFLSSCNLLSNGNAFEVKGLDVVGPDICMVSDCGGGPSLRFYSGPLEDKSMLSLSTSLAPHFSSMEITMYTFVGGGVFAEFESRIQDFDGDSIRVCTFSEEIDREILFETIAKLKLVKLEQNPPESTIADPNTAYFDINSEEPKRIYLRNGQPKIAQDELGEVWSYVGELATKFYNEGLCYSENPESL